MKFCINLRKYKSFAVLNIYEYTTQKCKYMPVPTFCSNAKKISENFVNISAFSQKPTTILRLKKYHLLNKLTRKGFKLYLYLWQPKL